MSFIDSARLLVDMRFPAAPAAILAGSAARGNHTPTSDLDLVVVIEGAGRSYRETVEWQGRPAELFVYTLDELPRWWHRDAAAHRNTLAQMCAEGISLRQSPVSETVQRDAADFVAAGPTRLTVAELDRRRYLLTDALDDLAGGLDRGEQITVAATVFTASAELALLSERRWLGSGKWLIRQVDAMDTGLATRLVEAFAEVASHGSAVALTAVTDQVLDRVGGRLTYGYAASRPER